MYEETKIKFDWKGFLLKFAIIILVVILVIKLLPTKQKVIVKVLLAILPN